jgi:transglutaminase-like putative cysteine protease
MTQAAWSDLFRRRPAGTPEPEPRADRPLRFLSWEDALTFPIVLIVFLSVVGSIDRAQWVEEMPSLYPVAFLGLLLGLALARTRASELFAHVLSLVVGGAAVLATLLFVLSGDSPGARVHDLTYRMGEWFGAAFEGGISTDPLPFIVIVVLSTWLTAYASAWAIFRWRNAWLGLVPGGLALLVNVSYLPDQFSFAFVLFLFGAILLVARMNVLDRMEQWCREGAARPEFLGVSTVAIALWVAPLLLLAAWLIPIAEGGGPLGAAWERISDPIASRVAEWSRLFASVDSKKTVSVHPFGPTLPFQGSITLTGERVMTVEAEEAGYLRAQAYETYTAFGWQTASREQRRVGANGPAGAIGELSQRRRTVAVEVEAPSQRDVIFSLGQPLSVDVPFQEEASASPSDVATLRPAEQLGGDGGYRSLGAVSEATVDELRGAGGDYPDAITALYLQLPADLPQSVGALAFDLTRFEDNPYDKARVIEEYLRTYPVDYDIPRTPAGGDSVDYFLFELRRGYFDYHASAMVVLLRAIGIPARLAVGYVLDESEREVGTDTYVVSGRSAFAWSEVYFPGLGWIDFNPTPSQPPIRRPGEAVAPGAAPPEDLTGEPADIPFAPGLPAIFGADEPQVLAEGGGSRAGFVILGALLGVAALLAASVGAVRLAWQRGLAGLDCAGQTWEKTVRLASWAKIGPRPQETPREFARGLRRELSDTPDLDFLTDAYVRSRFGHRPPSEGERARLETVWRGLRGRLLVRVLRRGGRGRPSG